MRLTPRKRLFVDKQVQGALLKRIVVYWCFSVLAVCLFVLCVRAITTPDGSFLDYFAFGEFFTRYGVVVLASLALVPLIMLDALAISNRFAGPLYRMRHSMRALAAGEHVEPVKFRDKDYWQNVAEEFNAVAKYVDELKQQIADAKAAAGKPRDLQSTIHE